MSQKKKLKKANKKVKELAQDQRNFQLRFRAERIADATFLMNKAANILRDALRHYPDLSLDPDFDESRDVTASLKFLEMAQDEIENGGYDINYHERKRLQEEYEKEIMVP